MELTKGLKRRLDIASALLKEAKVYIFDEPCAGIDIKTRGGIHKIVNELGKEKIVIFATHEIEDLKKMDRIIAIHNGIKVGELLVHENRDCVENFVKGVC
jgi:ABC-2 type transport system ATP-binding protein